MMFFSQFYLTFVSKFTTCFELLSSCHWILHLKQLFWQISYFIVAGTKEYFSPHNEIWFHSLFRPRQLSVEVVEILLKAFCVEELISSHKWKSQRKKKYWQIRYWKNLFIYFIYSFPFSPLGTQSSLDHSLLHFKITLWGMLNCMWMAHGHPESFHGRVVIQIRNSQILAQCSNHLHHTRNWREWLKDRRPQVWDSSRRKERGNWNIIISQHFQSLQ